MNRAIPVLAILLAGCSVSDGGGGSEKGEPASNAVMPGTGAEGPATNAAGAAPPRLSSPLVSRFTQGGLKPCRVIDKNEEEGPYYRHLCPGVGGYQYEVVESDLRQTMVIIAPDGRRGEVPLNRVGGGGFSRLGPAMEWRGPARAPPRSLIVRYNIQQGETGGDKSFLVVIRLAPTACIIGAVPPQRGQNERARQLADSLPSACLNP